MVDHDFERAVEGMDEATVRAMYYSARAKIVELSEDTCATCNMFERQHCAEQKQELRARLTQAEGLLDEAKPHVPEGLEETIDACLRGESSSSALYRMHVTGPDDIQDFDSEIAALREANETNKVWLRCQEECGWDENAPVVVATVSPAPEGESNGT